MEWLQEHLQSLKRVSSWPSLTLLANPGHVPSKFLVQLPDALILLSAGKFTGHNCMLPHALVLPFSGSLHQGTLKGSTQRGIQGPMWSSLIVILGSTIGTLFSTWQPCCGACAPTGTGPIPVSWWCSSPDAFCITHSRTVDSGGSGHLPNLSSQSSRQILLPALLVWRNFCSVR